MGGRPRNKFTVKVLGAVTDQSNESSCVVDVPSEYASGVVSEHVVR